MEDVRRLPVGEDNEGRISLDDLAREGALRMIAAALEAEVDDYVAFVRRGARRGRQAAGGPQREGQGAEADGRLGDAADPGAAGQRQARR